MKYCVREDNWKDWIMAEDDNDSIKEESASDVDSRTFKEEDICKDECDNEEINNADTGLNTNYDSSEGKIPTHRCERCDYESVSHTALLAHMAMCTSRSKMYECDVCQMKFSNSANMRRHKMRHTGVKPFECRICGKRFFRKDHLQEHSTTHAKANLFKCPICLRGFQRQIAMRAHFQNEHVQQGDAPIKSCPLCDFTAASMKSLRVHFHNRHGIDLDQPCYNTERVGESITPPMHFLTPHVEISLPQSPSSPQLVVDDDCAESPSGSPQSGDSNAPTSSQRAPEPVHLKSILNQTCQYCGITFPDSTLYLLHKGCHSEASPWKCNICGDQTANVYDFNSHLVSKNHQ